MMVLQVVTGCLVAVAMSLPLAHALEFPGKMRLSKEAYLATQEIYYPGFTLGGFAEPAGLGALFLLLVLTPRGTSEFWWTLAALIAFVAMHASYWVFTHPVNNFWLRNVHLKGSSAEFFHLGSGRLQGDRADWDRLRHRWEYSHVVRAALGALSFVFLMVAVAT